MRKTKIICTIGPSCNSTTEIKKLISAGMNVARINMSHGDQNSHQEAINNIKQARQSENVPIAIMLDTKGPEIRIKNFKNDYVILKKGQLFSLTTEDVEGDEKRVSLAYKPLINEVKVKDKIFANNGMLVLKVKQITQTDIICRVCFGGKLTNGKGLNIPGIVPKGEYLSQKDKEDLLFAIKNNVEYVAASFVSCAKDVEDLKAFLKQNNGEKIKVIAKIENAAGVKNLKEIMLSCEGIMIARGDLGVEIPLEKLPPIQKRIISLANRYGKIVIVATEMLESMTTSVRPTRAEVSDVANAIFELASATMLSGETAVGKHPEHTVKTMEKIICETEKHINYDKWFMSKFQNSNSITDAVSQSTCTNAIALHAKVIVVFTTTGESANMVARFRTDTPILAVTSNEHTYNALALSWGVQPYLAGEIESEEKMENLAKQLALDLKLAKENDIIIVQLGKPKQVGATNMSKVLVC